MARILLLHREFSAAKLRTAVERALSLGRLTADEIRQDLLNETYGESIKSGPVEVPDALATVDVPVGDPSSYNRLLGVSA